MRTSTSSTKVQTAFRLQSSLLDRLKANARKERVSLNQYVELLLIKKVGLNTTFPTVSKSFFDDLSEQEKHTCGSMPAEYTGTDHGDQVNKDNELLTKILTEKYA